jgi:UDP-glucose 4-epimerase
MKVCVIGGEGFVGSHLVERFDAIPVDNRSRAKHTFSNTVVGDVALPFMSDAIVYAIGASDVVIHAACSDIRESMTAPARDARVNIIGTLNVLRTCRNLNTPLLYISSVSIHSEASHYAVSKAAAEKYCLLYRQWIPTCVIRLSNVYGPRDTESVIAKWVSEPEIELIAPDATRDFVYVADAVNAIDEAVRKFPKEILDIGTGVVTRLGDLAEWMSKRRDVPDIPGA